MNVAHRTAAYLMGAGVLAALAIMLRGRQFGFPTQLHGPALGVDIAGILYLAMSAMAHWRLGSQEPRRLVSKKSMCNSMAAHTIVLVCLVWIALRGPVSRTYLAGRDLLVAELATAAVLSLALLLAAARSSRQNSGPITQESGAWPAIHLLASLFFVTCSVWLETRSIEP